MSFNYSGITYKRPRLNSFYLFVSLLRGKDFFFFWLVFDQFGLHLYYASKLRHFNYLVWRKWHWFCTFPWHTHVQWCIFWFVICFFLPYLKHWIIFLACIYNIVADFHSFAKGNINGDKEGWNAIKCWMHIVKRICMQGCFIYPTQVSVQIRICNSVNYTMNIHAGLSVFRIQRTMSIFSHNVTLTYVCLYNLDLLWVNKWI